MSIFKKNKTIRNLVSETFIARIEAAVNDSNRFYKEFNDMFVKESPLWLYNFQIEPNAAKWFEDSLDLSYKDRGFVVKKDPAVIDHDAKATFHLGAVNSMMDKSALFHANMLLAKDTLQSAIERQCGVSTVLFKEQVMGKEVDGVIYEEIAKDVSEILYKNGFICHADYFSRADNPSVLFNLPSLLDDPLVANSVVSSIVMNIMKHNSDSKDISRFDDFFATVMLSILSGVSRDGYIFVLKDRYNLIITEYDHSTTSSDIDKDKMCIHRNDFSKFWDKWS